MSYDIFDFTEAEFPNPVFMSAVSSFESRVGGAEHGIHDQILDRDFMASGYANGRSYVVVGTSILDGQDGEFLAYLRALGFDSDVRVTPCGEFEIEITHRETAGGAA